MKNTPKFSFQLPPAATPTSASDENHSNNEAEEITHNDTPPTTINQLNNNTQEDNSCLVSSPTSSTNITKNSSRENEEESTTNHNNNDLPLDLGILKNNPPPFPDFIAATKDMLSHFGGSVTNQLGSFLGQSILMMSIGRHYTVDQIASVGVGMSVNSIFGIAIGVGASSGCETLISQAFGRGDHHEVALWTQLGTIICLLLCIPITVLYLFSAPVVEFIFGSQYVDGATEFLLWAIPFLFVQSGAACVIKSFQSSGRADVPAKARLFSAFVMILGAIFLVPYLGIPGAALSMFFGSLTQLVVMFILVRYFDDDVVDENGTKKKLPILSVSWNPVLIFKKNSNRNGNTHPKSKQRLPTNDDDDDDEIDLQEKSHQQQATNVTIEEEERAAKTDTAEEEEEEDNQQNEDDQEEEEIDHKDGYAFLTLEHVWQFMQVAAPGAAAVLIEWTNFELMSVVTSHISRYDLAAFQIYLAVSMLFVGLAFALSISASAYVGKLLGQNDPATALLYGKTCVIWSMVLGLATGLFLIILRSQFFALYSDDEKLVSMLCGVVPIYVVLRTADNIQIVLQGICRGAARQKMVPFAVTFSLACIGIPSAFVLGKVLNFELAGVLSGFSFGLVTLVPILLYKMKDWDWMELAQEASTRRRTKMLLLEQHQQRENVEEAEEDSQTAENDVE